jgi:ferritin
MPGGAYDGLATLFLDETSEEITQQQEGYSNATDEPPVTEEIVVPKRE